MAAFLGAGTKAVRHTQCSRMTGSPIRRLLVPRFVLAPMNTLAAGTLLVPVRAALAKHIEQLRSYLCAWMITSNPTTLLPFEPSTSSISFSSDPSFIGEEGLIKCLRVCCVQSSVIGKQRVSELFEGFTEFTAQFLNGVGRFRLSAAGRPISPRLGFSATHDCVKPTGARPVIGRSILHIS